MPDRFAALNAYRTRTAAFHAARRLPGFQGYSLRRGCGARWCGADVVIDGVHVQLHPRLFGGS